MSERKVMFRGSERTRYFCFGFFQLSFDRSIDSIPFSPFLEKEKKREKREREERVFSPPQKRRRRKRDRLYTHTYTLTHTHYTHKTMGEESRTKKTRTKRPDQPNSKKLKEKVKKIKAERKPGITFAQKKKLKKEEELKKKYNTEFGKEGMVLKTNKGVKLGPMEIRYRALAKLLRQIEQLEERVEKDGLKLDAQQTKKLKRKAFVEEEMRQLIKAAKGEEDEEDEDLDDDDDEFDEDEEFSDDEEDEEDEDDDDDE